MGYIEQTDKGNVYVTDINDWFATLSNLNSECKNYTDSEIRYKEIVAEHDKQIIKKFVNEVDKYICTHHAKCEDCDFTYKTCFECFYHSVWLKEQNK